MSHIRNNGPLRVNQITTHIQVYQQYIEQQGIVGPFFNCIAKNCILNMYILHLRKVCACVCIQVMHFAIEIITL